jgi:hypothetical protein
VEERPHLFTGDLQSWLSKHGINLDTALAIEFLQILMTAQREQLLAWGKRPTFSTFVSRHMKLKTRVIQRTACLASDLYDI